MIELTTSYLNSEQLDAEVLAIVDDFKTFGMHTVHVTFGFGCDSGPRVESEDVPVPAGELARFIADSEADGTFELGEADLHIQGVGLKFLLCHERDVHCLGEESAALMAVRRRWRREYEYSQERRSGGRWRRLTGRPKDTRNP